MNQINVAIVGCGNISSIYLENLTTRFRNVNVYCVCDLAEEKAKAEAARDRVLDIDPNIQVTVRNTFFGPDTAAEFDFSQYSYVVDAIDTVTGKLALVTAAQAAGVPIISSMGTGNKLDPTKFQIADITKTSVCPLARIMRKECAKRGIKHLKVLFSTEDPITPTGGSIEELPEGRRALPGSVAFVPSVAGLISAGEVIKDLIK